MTIYGELNVQEAAGGDIASFLGEVKNTASRIPFPPPQTGIPVSVTFTSRYVPLDEWRASLVNNVSGESTSFGDGGTMTDTGPIDLVTWPLGGGVEALGGMHYLDDVCVTLLFNRT